MLQLKNIFFSFGAKKILKNLSFEVKKGEIVTIIGVSGSGKTTLFRLITRMLQPDSGTIFPDDNEKITYMRQEDLLLGWRTVLENLLLFTELGKKRPTLIKDPLYLLERVGLKNCEHLYPDELSGGMKSRVSLARALLQNRPIFLLDEPFGSLDVIIREELYELVKEICRAEEKTILLVTHDFRDALALSDRILVLADGTITQDFKVPSDSRECEKLQQSIREELLLQMKL